jgi:hypothetical protein
MPNRVPTSQPKLYPISAYPQKTRRRSRASFSKSGGRTDACPSDQPKLFHEALDFQMKQHRDTSTSLISAIAAGDQKRQLGALWDHCCTCQLGV